MFVFVHLTYSHCSSPSFSFSANDAESKNHSNISFLANFISQQHDKCLELLIQNGRLAEAAMFARTYFPSKISETVELWKASLVEQEQPKIAESIADPEKYDNLFEDYRGSLQAETFVQKQNAEGLPSAGSYPTVDKSTRDIYREDVQMN